MSECEKKIPIRRCTGCGARLPKRELLRVLRTPEGKITVDQSGKQNGRGAYLCPKNECFKKLKKTGRLSQHLGIPIGEEIYRELEEEISRVEHP